MITFPAYAANFELYPKDGEASRHLLPLVNGLGKIDFEFRVNDPKINQGQLDSDLDLKLEAGFQSCGTTPCNLPLPFGVPQELDFSFNFGGRIVAVEIEKTNREKILRDILKCHIYLHSGAQYALVVLPRNYAHKHCVWNLFKFGIERFDECLKYAFGTPDKLGKIALLGFDQVEAGTNRLLTKAIREEMRVKAAKQLQAS